MSLSILDLPKDVLSLIELDPKESSYLRATCRYMRKSIRDKSETYRNAAIRGLLFKLLCEDGYAGLAGEIYLQCGPYHVVWPNEDDVAKNGHLDVLLMMDKYSMNCMRSKNILIAGARGGHKHIIDYAIEHGATNIDYAIGCAKNEEIVQHLEKKRK